MKYKDFAVFILTHKRPHNVKTLNTLKQCGYTGEIYFIIDNEDNTVDQYIKNFGAKYIRVFDKKAMADKIDEGNNFDERRTITHARNACFNIAREIGITYFMQLDDDYTSFEWRYENKTGDKLLVHRITNLDAILDWYLDFYSSIVHARGLLVLFAPVRCSGSVGGRTGVRGDDNASGREHA